ncbi:MAG TPA: acyl-CoA dehydrogenase family protein [Vicinamibacterales bacterium]
MTAGAAVTAAAFLDEAHVECASAIARWTRDHLLQREEPRADEEARREARALVGELGSAGWFSAIARQDLRTLSLVRDAVAAASPLADAVLALQALGGTPIVLAGSARQRDEWLAPIVGGRAMAAFAMTEPDAGSDVAAMHTAARRDGADWVLDGEKHLISNAGLADVYVVFAVTSPGEGSRGISAFLVPADARGLAFAGAQTMAAAHPLGRLRFDGCRVGGDALLGEVNRGFTLGMTTLDRLRPTVGAAACGMAARALDEAIARAATRRQFGRPLGDLQIIREKLGRMATELQASRLLVYYAAWLKDRGADRITVEAAMAKSYATEAAQRIIDDAVQIMGGAGVLLGNPVERLYRAVRALRIYEGATEVQRLIVGAALLKDGAEV